MAQLELDFTKCRRQRNQRHRNQPLLSCFSEGK